MCLWMLSIDLHTFKHTAKPDSRHPPPNNEHDDLFEEREHAFRYLSEIKFETGQNTISVTNRGLNVEMMPHIS